MMLSLEERPRKFSDVIGNEVKLEGFKKMSKTLKFPNVMFFVGDTGSGKTTTALIIASLLTGKNNLVNPDGTQDPNPEDSSYKAIVAENWGAQDVYFYVADKMTPQDIEQINVVCSSGSLFGGSNSRKVIIIDEAQNLKKNAKGLTLTFLEQKRFITSGVHVILCTMEPEAFDKATLDRGQVYEFRAPSPTNIGNFLFAYLEKNGLVDTLPQEFVVDGLVVLRDNCNGSLRKALQDLQRCLADELFTTEKILSELAYISVEALGNDLTNLMDRKPEALIRIARYFREDHVNMMHGALADAYFYRATGRSREGWRSGSSRIMSTHPALPELLAIFDDVFRSRGPYFRPDILLYRFSKFILDGPSGLTQAPPPPSPPGLPRRRG